MKHTQIFFAMLFMIFCTAPGAKAQNEAVPPFALGLRVNPDGAGVTGKFFFTENVAFEGIVSGSNGSYSHYGPSTTFTGLFEYNFIFDDPAWRVFLGVGAHITSWKEYTDNNNPRQTYAGADAIAGLEYVFTEVPVGVSVDIKPAINFVNGVTTFPNNTFGLGVRYYFGRWANKLAEHPDEIETGRK